MPTYRVSTWDHEADGWAVEAAGIGLWALRGVLRDLYGRSYDTVSILVQREG